MGRSVVGLGSSDLALGQDGKLRRTHSFPNSSYQMPLPIEVEQEGDGRWLAEIPELPGVLVSGSTPAESVARVQALRLRVLADRVENGEPIPASVAVLVAMPA